MTYIYRYSSPLGDMTMANDGSALTGLWFDGQKYFAGFPAGTETRELPVFAQTARWLDVYFSGRAPDFTPPLAAAGSPFRQAVWDKLRAVPYGKLTTYGKIAAALAAESGKRVSAQAVGGAVGHNPLAIIVPCHRVVGSDGSLTGYAGGLDRKRKLLALEGADMHMYVGKGGAL